MKYQANSKYQIKDLSVFIQLLNDSGVNNFKCLLLDASYHIEDWPPDRFVDHLDNLYEHRKGNHFTFECIFYTDSRARIEEITVIEHHLPLNGVSAKDYWTKWGIKYTD